MSFFKNGENRAFVLSQGRNHVVTGLISKRILNMIKWGDPWYDQDDPDRLIWITWTVYFLWFGISFKKYYI
jgi:hypothetical protein